MLSQDLHEAVKAGFIDLGDIDFGDVRHGRNMSAEERALSSAVLKTGKAFIRDPKNILDEEGITAMLYRGLKKIDPGSGAAFDFFANTSTASYGMELPADVKKHIKITKVKGRTGNGWKIVAKLDNAIYAIGAHVLGRALRKSKIPVDQNGSDLRSAYADEFMQMQSKPHKADSPGYWWYFKHGETRNYLFVNSADGRLYIPRTNKPFFLGAFGYA